MSTVVKKCYNNGVANKNARPLHQHVLPTLLEKVARWVDCNRPTDTIEHKFDNKVKLDNMDVSFVKYVLVVHIIYFIIINYNKLSYKTRSMVKLELTISSFRPTTVAFAVT